VTSDKRKGLISLVQDNDSLVHFYWKDRSSGVVEDDLMIFPSECTVKKVPQCTTGRVILLEWTESKSRRFFWMQEPKDDKDDKLIEDLNKQMNDPSPPQQAGGLGGLGDLSQLGGLEGLDQQQLIALLTGAGGLGAGGLPGASPAGAQPSAPSAGTAPAAPAGGAAIQVGDLQNILGSLMPQVGQAENQGQAQAPAGPGLSSLLSPESVIPLLHDPAVQPQILALAEHLPEGQRSVEEIEAQLRGPQFAQMVETLNMAIQTGQAGGLLREFGLDASAVERGGGIQALVEAFQRAHPEEKKDDDKMDTS
jgi:hypothetical protein